MQTIVIYSSQTGNTRKLATQIFAAIPGDSKDLKNIDEYREKDAELYFVGFGWTEVTVTKRQQHCFRDCMAKRSLCSEPAGWETILPITRR